MTKATEPRPGRHIGMFATHSRLGARSEAALDENGGTGCGLSRCVLRGFRAVVPAMPILSSTGIWPPDALGHRKQPCWRRGRGRVEARHRCGGWGSRLGRWAIGGPPVVDSTPTANHQPALMIGDELALACIHRVRSFALALVPDRKAISNPTNSQICAWRTHRAPPRAANTRRRRAPPPLTPDRADRGFPAPAPPAYPPMPPDMTPSFP